MSDELRGKLLFNVDFDVEVDVEWVCFCDVLYFVVFDGVGFIVCKN